MEYPLQRLVLNRDSGHSALLFAVQTHRTRARLFVDPEYRATPFRSDILMLKIRIGRLPHRKDLSLILSRRIVQIDPAAIGKPRKQHR